MLTELFIRYNESKNEPLRRSFSHENVLSIVKLINEFPRVIKGLKWNDKIIITKLLLKSTHQFKLRSTPKTIKQKQHTMYHIKEESAFYLPYSTVTTLWLNKKKWKPNMGE